MNSPERKGVPQDPLARLRAALDDPLLVKNLASDGPLYLGEVPDVKKTAEFAGCVERYGWPSQANAAEIAPTRQEMYRDADDFWIAMFDDIDPDRYMNNFKNWLSVAPVDEQYAGMSMSEMVYGMQPALHRAHVLYEDLFTGLNEAFPARDRDPLDLTDEERAVLPEASFTAYQLLGKLLTDDDQRMTVRQFGGDAEGVSSVIDAHDYLWQ